MSNVWDRRVKLTLADVSIIQHSMNIGIALSVKPPSPSNHDTLEVNHQQYAPGHKNECLRLFATLIGICIHRKPANSNERESFSSHEESPSRQLQSRILISRFFFTYAGDRSLKHVWRSLFFLLTRSNASHAWFSLWYQRSNSNLPPPGIRLTWTVRRGVPRYEEICLRLIVAWSIWRFSLVSVVNGVPRKEEPRQPPLFSSKGYWAKISWFVVICSKDETNTFDLWLSVKIVKSRTLDQIVIRKFFRPDWGLP